ncbi:MAG: endo-1,4-beta-xylanase [Tepidisphaeraceae bacterium]
MSIFPFIVTARRKIIFHAIVPLLFLIGIMTSSCTTDPVSSSLPPGGQLLAKSGLTPFTLFGVQQELGKFRIVDVEHSDFKQAMEIETSAGARAEWNVQIVAPVNQAVKKGDVLLACFWLRCIQSMTGEGYTAFEFEQNHGEFDKAVDFKISGGRDWKEVFVPFESDRDFSAGETRICFRAGYDRQTIQIGGVEVRNYRTAVKFSDLPRTKITYAGREPDAAWRQDALRRIEKIRKGDLNVCVTDAAGAPIPGASVHAVLRRHAFGFGTCVDAQWLLGKGADNDRYRQTILSLFNRAVFENDMKWPEVWKGVPPDVDRALKWLKEHDIAVRGHNLVWPSWRWLPPELKAYEHDPKRLRDITARHITDTVAHFRGQLDEWDVVNEPFTNHDLFDLLGGGPIVIEWYNLAHAADPSCRLFLNDFGVLDGGAYNEHRENFYDNIKYLKDNGAPIGGIGIQSHFGTELAAPADIIKILDRFSTFGLPIEATEVSFNLQDRQLQAEYLRDYMIALFSEPRVQDIILWGFWAKRHWRPGAALYDEQWNMRPIAQAWIDLTQKQWTTDLTSDTNGDGVTDIRGFYGTYDVTVTAGSLRRTLSAELKPGGTRLAVRME